MNEGCQVKDWGSDLHWPREAKLANQDLISLLWQRKVVHWATYCSTGVCLTHLFHNGVSSAVRAHYSLCTCVCCEQGPNLLGTVYVPYLILNWRTHFHHVHVFAVNRGLSTGNSICSFFILKELMSHHGH